MAPAVIPSVMKKEPEQAVMQSKQFIFFSHNFFLNFFFFTKITSLMFCDSNFLYRILLISNMALKGRFSKTATQFSEIK